MNKYFLADVEKYFCKVCGYLKKYDPSIRIVECGFVVKIYAKYPKEKCWVIVYRENENYDPAESETVLDLNERGLAGVKTFIFNQQSLSHREIDQMKGEPVELEFL